MCRIFLQSGSAEIPKHSKMSWAQVCISKQEGGLGLKYLKTWNRVHGLKLIWLNSILIIWFLVGCLMQEVQAQKKMFLESLPQQSNFFDVEATPQTKVCGKKFHLM